MTLFDRKTEHKHCAPFTNKSSQEGSNEYGRDGDHEVSNMSDNKLSRHERLNDAASHKPIKQLNQPSPPNPLNQTGETSSVEANQAPVRILFVDDERAILAAIKRLTRNIAAHFEFVTSPLKALEIIAQQNIDIIVSDMRMPEMDGVTFLSEVAANYPETIRIMLTGNADSELVMSAINKGRIWSFIEKPWDSEQLILTLQQAIQTRNLMRSRVNHLYHELEQAKLAADSGSQEKSNFLAVMSHEIRTPMNAMLGSMELLTSTALDDHQRQLLNNALTAGESLSTLVNDILDFSKIEAGKLQLTPHEFNTLDLVDDLHSLFIERAKEKGIGLMFCLSPQLSSQLMLDEQRVKQILINLIANAIKFTQHGGVEVSIYANDSVLQCEVRDTGVGIKNEDISKLFKKFVQADSSYKRQFEGTGLGLAITKQLAELMGGEIRVGSKEGEGSTFLVVIPHQHYTQPLVASESLTHKQMTFVNFSPFYENAIKKQLHLWQCQVDFVRDSSGGSQVIQQLASLQANPQSPLQHQLQRQEQEDNTYDEVLLFNEGETRWLASPSELMALVLGQAVSKKDIEPGPCDNLTGHGERILVVEDSLPNQLVITTMLERAGYQVDIANNGAEAVKQVECERYALVLMDLSMPVMDGAQACRIIRSKSPQFKQLPIWAMTANVTKDDMQHCFAAGMNEFVEKPINREQLLLKIYSYFEQIRQQQSLSNTVANSDREQANLTSTVEINAETNAETNAKTTVATKREPSPITQHSAALSASPKSAADKKIIEKPIIDQLLVDTGEEIFQRVLHLFVDETRRRIAVIEQAQIKADASQIEKEAHAIKSSAASVGAIGLGELAKQLEHVCQRQPSNGQLSDATISLVEQVSESAVLALQALEQDYLGHSAG
ncbi:response regulator [Thalassotalea euphylliae]|uniref:histidine kinase n=1 Tax=Thalassotalea euphylliae TaxID=1655234 RepID=A0A3E0TUA1_9GAMM|nr:response regulator [Thalassotalea euphylliae]REL28014.1 response regulator [Thalassotalea euphylliae]